MSGTYPTFIPRKINPTDSGQFQLLMQQNAQVIQSLTNGRVNSTGDLSLTYTGAGTRVTTVSDPLCTINSMPYFTATNLRGSKLLQQYYISNITNGSFDINWDETVSTVTGGNPANLRYVLLG